MKKYPSGAYSSDSRTLRRYVVVAGLVLSVGLTIAPGAVSTAYADELASGSGAPAAIEAAMHPGEGSSSSSANAASQAEGKAAASSAENASGVEAQNSSGAAPAKSGASEASAPVAGESGSVPAGEGAASTAAPATGSGPSAATVAPEGGTSPDAATPATGSAPDPATSAAAASGGLTLAAAPAAEGAAAPTAGVVAKIGEQSYATLDEAVAAAKSGDTIVLVANATSQGISMKGDLVINGAGNTITFVKDGIAIFNHALTFKDAIVSMMGIGSTPYAEWKWMAICASKDGSLTLDNTAMTLDGTGAASGTHAIYFTSNNKLNVTNGSTLVVSNYPQDALEWDGGDGGYNLNVIGGSKVVLDHNRSGIAGTFFVKVDASELTVINNRGNGSNGSHFDIANGSEVSFKDNGSHGLSAGKLFVKGSAVTCTGNGLYGITVGNSLNVDGTSTLKANGNKTKASASSGGGLRITKNAKENFIAKGAVVEINNNGGNGLENYADLFIEEGVDLSILQNYEKGNGGGIYNGATGSLTLPSGAKIHNNTAAKAGDDIYSLGKIVVPATGEWILDQNHDGVGDHAITGWFEDGLGSDNPQRWQAHAEDEDANYMIEIEEGSFEIPLALKATHGIQVDPEEGDVPVGPGESEDPGKAEDPGSVKTVSAEKAEVVATSSAKSVSPKTGDSAGFSLAAAAMSVLAAISAAFAALRRRED